MCSLRFKSLGIFSNTGQAEAAGLSPCGAPLASGDTEFHKRLTAAGEELVVSKGFVCCLDASVFPPYVCLSRTENQ